MPFRYGTARKTATMIAVNSFRVITRHLQPQNDTDNDVVDDTAEYHEGKASHEVHVLSEESHRRAPRR